MTIFIFLGSLLGAMALGMPIAFSLLLSGVALMWHLDLFDAQILAQNVINGADSFPLLAVPFFMLAGEIMNVGGLSKRIVNLALTLVGHVRGGLGFVAIVAAVPDGGAVGLGGGRHRGAGRAAAADDGQGRPRQGALGRADRLGRHHRADHPAVDRLRHLRRRRQRVDQQAVPGRHRARAADGRGDRRHLVVGAPSARTSRRRARPARRERWQRCGRRPGRCSCR